MDTVERHDKSRIKRWRENTRMLGPLLKTDWKDVRQSPYEILSTEQETGKPYRIPHQGISL